MPFPKTAAPGLGLFALSGTQSAPFALGGCPHSSCPPSSDTIPARPRQLSPQHTAGPGVGCERTVTLVGSGGGGHWLTLFLHWPQLPGGCHGPREQQRALHHLSERRPVSAGVGWGAGRWSGAPGGGTLTPGLGETQGSATALRLVQAPFPPRPGCRAVGPQRALHRALVVQGSESAPQPKLSSRHPRPWPLREAGRVISCTKP